MVVNIYSCSLAGLFFCRKDSTVWQPYNALPSPFTEPDRNEPWRSRNDDCAHYVTAADKKVDLLAGFVFMAVGMWMYMSAEQCCGPRDALLVGLGKRMPKIPIGIVEVILWAVVLLIGYLLGGPVGIGTLISTFGAGVVMQLVYSMIGFEPRKLNHRDVTNVIRSMKYPVREINEEMGSRLQPGSLPEVK